MPSNKEKINRQYENQEGPRSRGTTKITRGIFNDTTTNSNKRAVRDSSKNLRRK